MSIDKYYVSDKNIANMRSYGEKKGNFFIPNEAITNILIEKNNYTSYALVEVKSEYYKLINKNLKYIFSII